MKKQYCYSSILLSFLWMLFWGSFPAFSSDEGAPAKAKRNTSLYTELSFGRDEYRSQYLSAQIGVDKVFAFPISVSRNINAFTDASLSFSGGGDWDLGANLTPRVIFNFYREPNSVTGIGLSFSNRFHLEGLWKGERSSVLTVGVEGTRYVDRGSVTVAGEQSGLFTSKKGRGRGGSTSARLASGVFQSSAWLSWNHSLTDLWSLSASAQKYFYLGAAPVDGNAAISDRPYVPNQAQLLVDGFPEWTADVGGSVWFDTWDLGSKVAFSRARNSASGVIVAPAINGGWNATEILSIGGSVSYAIQSKSTLVSINAEWMW
ncbi:MAG: hypothetical protein KGP28_08160 [Bdellovibrionales bacterium]|nr:hypothetical protein [Bdellovibrionales bacterium]